MQHTELPIARCAVMIINGVGLHILTNLSPRVRESRESHESRVRYVITYRERLRGVVCLSRGPSASAPQLRSTRRNCCHTTIAPRQYGRERRFLLVVASASIDMCNSLGLTPLAAASFRSCSHCCSTCSAIFLGGGGGSGGGSGGGVGSNGGSATAAVGGSALSSSSGSWRVVGSR